MKIIKKALLFLLMLLGFLIAILTVTAIRITDGFDSESINILTGYISGLNGTNGSMELLGSEAGILFFFHKIKEYSHWIFTGCALWIILILYFLTRKVDKNEKK